MDSSDIGPLCVDLDGTLIYSDVMFIAWGQLFKKDPFLGVFSIFWFLKGRAYFKAKLAQHAVIDPSQLRYTSFLSYVKEYKAQNSGEVWLVTASDIIFAQAVAQYLDIFDGVLASQGKINLRAQAKAQALVTHFGEKGFTYAGNSYDDLSVWPHAKHAIAVNLSRRALWALKKNPIHFLARFV